MELPADVDAAVAARMRRQNVLYTGGRVFDLLLEEQVLRTQVGDTEVMAGQLDRLMAMTSVPAVRMGIIASRAPRATGIHSSFWIFDDSRVQVETPSALLVVTQPAEVSIYAQGFDALQRSAAYGRNARELIARSLRELTGDLFRQPRATSLSPGTAGSYALVSDGSAMNVLASTPGVS
jgi:hypothetical protein